LVGDYLAWRKPQVTQQQLAMQQDGPQHIFHQFMPVSHQMYQLMLREVITLKLGTLTQIIQYKSQIKTIMYLEQTGYHPQSK
jgi:hypothetical protein